MKNTFYIGLVFLLFQCGTSRGVLQSERATSRTRLFVDELNKRYTLERNNTLIKYDENGKKLFEYSDNTLGSINVLDVSNPLQILVFHNDFQTIKIFDRTLTPTTRLDLNRLNLFEIKVVASANDNRIWIFDELNQELLKLDKNGMIQGRNNDLRLRLQSNAMPYRIIEFQNTVYLFDKLHGILIFNAFGEYVSQRDFSHGDNFTYWQGKLFFMTTEGLNVYDIQNGDVQMEALPAATLEGVDHHLIKKEVIYLKDKTIQVNSIQ